MSTDSTHSPDQRRAALSALMDGEAGACDAACSAWRGHSAARADWHAYHLIGDLMRSDEHSADALRDARMLARVREQLSHEPVVLAPAPASAAAFTPKRRAPRWMVPAAVAAGFAAVAGALLVTGIPDGAPGDRGGLVAGTATPGAIPAAVQAPKIVPATADNAPTMIRSAELDRYLAAHRQYANGALQVAPGGVVRQAAVAAPGR